MPDQLTIELQEAGNDVETAIDRIGGSLDSYKYFLQKFLNDKNYDLLVEALSAGDEESAMTYAHTLKGVSGNLGLDRLFAYLDHMVSVFRKQRTGDVEQLMQLVTEEYKKLSEIIRRNLQ